MCMSLPTCMCVQVCLSMSGGGSVFMHEPVSVCGAMCGVVTVCENEPVFVCVYVRACIHSVWE